MIIGTEKAIKILTGIREYCKDKSWCIECPLGRNECDELLGLGEIPSGWEINLSIDKSENKFIIGRERAAEILTNIKITCGSNKCWTCSLSGECDEVLGDEVPFDWEINLKDDTKVSGTAIVDKDDEEQASEDNNLKSE